MNGRVMVVCASRGRPDELIRMLDSVRDTSKNADVSVYLDEDQGEEYKRVIDKYSVSAPGEPAVRFVVGPRLGQCRSLNYLVSTVPGYEAYGAATDDSCFKTPGWDEWVLGVVESFPSRIGVIAPFSGSPFPRMDFPWVTLEWIKLVGAFTVLGTHHSYWDVALQILGEETQIRFATKDDFEMWHEGLSGNALPDKGQSDISKVVHNIYHVYNDAHCVCVWLATVKHVLVGRINEAIASRGG